MVNDNRREYITAIMIEKGIITLIQPDGTIGYYHQRGIKKIDPKTRSGMIALGYLDANWEKCQELPRNWSISYEDTEIMGRAYAGFPVAKVVEAMKADIEEYNKRKKLKDKG